MSPCTLWSENATTVAGQANGTDGSSIDYLNYSMGIYISNDDILFIADARNHRIVMVADNGGVTTFGSGPGIELDKFNVVTDVFVTETLIYTLDTGNFRVKKYFRNETNPITMPGAVSFDYSYCLFIDKFDNLYISDSDNDEVRCFAPGFSISVRVAGSGTEGSMAHQLNRPRGIFVDDNRTVYVADIYNHRIQKWFYEATSGITVAGDGTNGSSSTQLSYPTSVIVDINGYMYITDYNNNRIIRWMPNSVSGVCIAACLGTWGIGLNQLRGPLDLAFDSYGSLYISDSSNNRVQKFQILDGISYLNNIYYYDFVILDKNTTTRWNSSTLSNSLVSSTVQMISMNSTTKIVTSTLLITSTSQAVSLIDIDIVWIRTTILFSVLLILSNF